MPKKRKRGPRTKSGQPSRAYTTVARDNGTTELQAKRLAAVGAGADPALSATMPGVLYARGVLDQEQFDRAERYRHLRCALYGPPWPANAPVGSNGLPDDEAIRRMQKSFDNLVAPLDPRERSVVSRVCVFDERPDPGEVDVLRGALGEMG